MSLSRFFITGIQTIGKEVKLGKLGDQELLDWNSLSRLSRGFNGKTGSEWLGNSMG